MPLGSILKKSELRGPTIKNLHKELNTMERCKKWKTSTRSKCPLCFKKKETWKHILQCKNEHAVRVRKDQLAKLSESLKKLKTDTAIYQLFLSILRTILENKSPLPPEPVPNQQLTDELLDIFHDQRRIGWESFLQGLISTKWKIVQQRLYDEDKMDQIKYNGDRWAKTMVNMMFQFNRTMWKNRCEIVHLLNEETLEQRKRQQLQKKWEKLKRQPWRLRARDRHLIAKEETFFTKATKLAIDMWEQQLFVALEQAHETVEGNDIRQYGTVTKRINSEVLELRPTQTIVKYNQTRLNVSKVSHTIKPSRIVRTTELQEQQTKIEKQMHRKEAYGRRKNKIQLGKTYNQHHIRDYFGNNNKKPRGHRCMTRSSHVRVTRKINNQIN